MTELIRSEPFILPEPRLPIRPPGWIDRKSAPCAGTDRDEIGAVCPEGEVDLSEIGAVCEAPTWYLYCTIFCYQTFASVSFTENVIVPKDVPDPTELHCIGTATNEVELVGKYSAHIEYYRPTDHRPWVFVLPQEVPSFTTWLKAHGLERGRRYEYPDEYNAACRQYMNEIGEPSIFRMPPAPTAARRSG